MEHRLSARGAVTAAIALSALAAVNAEPTLPSRVASPLMQQADTATREAAWLYRPRDGQIINSSDSVGSTWTAHSKDSYRAAAGADSVIDIHLHPATSLARDSMVDSVITPLIREFAGLDYLVKALAAHQAIDGFLALPSPRDLITLQTKQEWLGRPLVGTVVSPAGVATYQVSPNVDANKAANMYEMLRDQVLTRCAGSASFAANPEGTIAQCIATRLHVPGLRISYAAREFP